MKNAGLFILRCCLVVWVVVSAAAQGSQPHALHSDQRIRQIVYDPNAVIEITGTYGYVTTIEFAPDEVITGRTFGDSIAWQTLVRDNQLYLKPVEPEAGGNMTVVTDKRTYLFKLDSSNTDMTYLVRFAYPELLTRSGQADVNTSRASGRELRAGMINLNYASAGHRSAIPLVAVFDDGQFTYFEFAAQADIPGIYLVESDGTESMLNLHRDGVYLVAERTARMFTLRNGSAHLCVENRKFAAGAG